MGHYQDSEVGLGKPFNPVLYNLDDDIGETTNVATAHPDVVNKLLKYAVAMESDLGINKKNGPGVREPGRIEHPTGLWLPGQMPPQSSAYDPSNPLRIGDQLGRDESPQIAKKPFTITCEVEPKSANAVIVAQGGKKVGYSLFLSDGIPVFAVREHNEIYTVTATNAPAATYQIEARLETDGVMTLTVNGVATHGKADGLITSQPSENLCVGFDDGAPVAEYKGSATDPFQGKISGLKVVTN
jgi:hypothetical protein